MDARASLSQKVRGEARNAREHQARQGHTLRIEDTLPSLPVIRAVEEMLHARQRFPPGRSLGPA